MNGRKISTSIVHEEFFAGLKYTETDDGYVNLNLADQAGNACASMTLHVETARALGAILAHRFGEKPKKIEGANNV